MTIDPRTITPVILTCDGNIAFVRTFVESWEHRNIGSWLPKPVVVIDRSKRVRKSVEEEYNSLIAKLQPREVVVHEQYISPYPPTRLTESVNDAAFLALSEAVRLSSEEESYVLFLEDDIVFSGLFETTLRGYTLPDNAALLTFYRPRGSIGDYGDRQILTPEEFYGTQCVLFPRKAINELLKHYSDLKQIPRGLRRVGYDNIWVNHLGKKGMTVHSTEKSVIQHIGTESRLNSPKHVATDFTDD